MVARPRQAGVKRILPLLKAQRINPAKRSTLRPFYLALFLASAPTVLASQQTAPSVPPLEIGAVAPDFAMNGATRYGVLARPIHLSDFKGKTVPVRERHRDGRRQAVQPALSHRARGRPRQSRGYDQPQSVRGGTGWGDRLSGDPVPGDRSDRIH
jgi:hypothetical protein